MENTVSKSKQQGFLLYIAWFVSLIAMFGSLYFSEIKGYIPCELCWYQRILMYPLTLILGIGTFQNDISVKKFVTSVINNWGKHIIHALFRAEDTRLWRY